VERGSWDNVPLIDQSAPLSYADLAIETHRNIISWINNGAEVTLSNSGPEIDKKPDGVVALLTIAVNRFHDV